MPSGWKPFGSASTSGRVFLLLPLPWCATAGTATAALRTSATAIRMRFMLPEPPPGRLCELHEHIRSHRSCGFAICDGALNLVPGEGPQDAEVMVVGEAPGRFEDEQGRPFVGRAGQLLDEVLCEAGFAREEVFITNVVKARPPGNRDPTRAAVEHWMPVLELQLALVAPRLVVPVGRHALAHFAPGAKIGEVHGRAISERGRELFPLYHPAAALRSTKLRETLMADARALGDLARLRGAGFGYPEPMARLEVP